MIFNVVHRFWTTTICLCNIAWHETRKRGGLVKYDTMTKGEGVKTSKKVWHNLCTALILHIKVLYGKGRWTMKSLNILFSFPSCNFLSSLPVLNFLSDCCCTLVLTVIRLLPPVYPILDRNKQKSSYKNGKRQEKK